MQEIRTLSSIQATTLSSTAATLVGSSTDEGGGYILHNPTVGAHLYITLSDGGTGPTTVDGTNALFVLGYGDSLTLATSRDIALYAQSDLAGAQINFARWGA